MALMLLSSLAAIHSVCVVTVMAFPCSMNVRTCDSCRRIAMSGLYTAEKEFLIASLAFDAVYYERCSGVRSVLEQ